jgi:hypothetical protein
MVSGWVKWTWASTPAAQFGSMAGFGDTMTVALSGGMASVFGSPASSRSWSLA